MLFGILSAIAFTIGVAGLATDPAIGNTVEEPTPIVQEYGPIDPVYSEED